MRILYSSYKSCHRVRFAACGFTMVEVLIAMGLASLVLAAVLTAFVFSARSFAAMYNYTDMDSNSRSALDRMSKDIRQATSLVGFNDGASAKSLTFTNALSAQSIVFAWDSSSGNLICRKTGQANQTYLTGCKSWSFKLYQRTPKPNYQFFTNSMPSQCKLVEMNWKCTRRVLGVLDSEVIETAQIVIRN